MFCLEIHINAVPIQCTVLISYNCYEYALSDSSYCLQIKSVNILCFCLWKIFSFPVFKILIHNFNLMYKYIIRQSTELTVSQSYLMIFSQGECLFIVKQDTFEIKLFVIIMVQISLLHTCIFSNIANKLNFEPCIICI